MMYRLLTGSLPFPADTPAAVIYRHLHEAPPPVRQAAPDVPAELEAVVARLLAKTPRDRYQTAGEALEAIAACRRLPRAAPSLTPVQAEKDGLPRTGPARRLGTTLGLVGLAAAALLILITGVHPRWMRHDRLGGRSESTAASADVAAREARDGPRLGHPRRGDGHGAAGERIPATGETRRLRPGAALPREVWIDVLPYMDFSWHTVSGQWHREGNAVVVDPWLASRIMLPFEIDGDYDLRVDFARLSGDKSVRVLIPVGRRCAKPYRRLPVRC
jgi:hypothetical protein